MGIDVYLRWEGQTGEEEQAQYTGFSTVSGNVGYLREAYHGGPYATRVLAPEAFSADNAEADIPAAVLRERLPAVIAAAEERYRKNYGEDLGDRQRKSFEEFVALAEAKEATTGKPCKVIASY